MGQENSPCSTQNEAHNMAHTLGACKKKWAFIAFYKPAVHAGFVLICRFVKCKLHVPNKQLQRKWARRFQFWSMRLTFRNWQWTSGGTKLILLSWLWLLKPDPLMEFPFIHTCIPYVYILCTLPLLQIWLLYSISGTCGAFSRYIACDSGATVCGGTVQKAIMWLVQCGGV